MPRDGIADDVAEGLDPLTALPAWVKGEKASISKGMSPVICSESASHLATGVQPRLE